MNQSLHRRRKMKFLLKTIKKVRSKQIKQKGASKSSHQINSTSTRNVEDDELSKSSSSISTVTTREETQQEPFEEPIETLSSSSSNTTITHEDNSVEETILSSKNSHEDSSVYPLSPLISPKDNTLLVALVSHNDLKVRKLLTPWM